MQRVRRRRRRLHPRELHEHEFAAVVFTIPLGNPLGNPRQPPRQPPRRSPSSRAAELGCTFERRALLATSSAAASRAAADISRVTIPPNANTRVSGSNRDATDAGIA